MSATLVDWRDLQARHAVRHNPDPNALDDAFEPGSTADEFLPGQWDLRHVADGVSPASDNVFDAWSSIEQRDGNTFLYPAFTREASSGSTFLTFELNQDSRGLAERGFHAGLRATC